jgi:hypothetical protein
VPAARGDDVGRQRDVDRLLDQDALIALGLQVREPFVVRRLDRDPSLVDATAGVGTCLWR